jgi:hypothetical protein
MSNPKAKKIFLPNKFLSLPYAKTVTYIMLIPTFSFGQNASEYDTTIIKKNTIIVQPFIAKGEYLLKPNYLQRKKSFIHLHLDYPM